ncbi:hypothetical protein [Kyrpidia tusciae]|uniref:DUF8042 domain-containing protein n=1 Tax=Kyrpidia tusciae (strain DSM 2912 / NBRC 15312 / T2) TaxID=562970 RepID=D5WVR6_KYRT2|nr:hypothetical protein [Kyrpidia tusciae]ADG07609.1 conserved hypothetical protein [Kyrpidia tusciae DSM 2912]
MEKYRLVAQRLLVLSDTCLEALEHIRERMNDGHIHGTVFLFADVVEAVYIMDEALKPVLPQLSQADHLESCLLEIWTAMESMADFYDQRNSTGLMVQLQERLLPSYREWKESLENTLHGYAVC